MHAWITVDPANLSRLSSASLVSGDVLIVNAGGRSPDALRETINDCRYVLPGYPVYLQSGPKRVRELAHLGGNDGHLLDWEQASWNADRELAAQAPWTWDFDDTLQRITAIMTPVDGPWGLVITAAPLMNKRLIRQGVYWRYDVLATVGKLGMIAQTQGFLERSPVRAMLDTVRGNSDWELAVARLREQVIGRDVDHIGVEVALGDTPNSVTPSRAAVGARQAVRVGIPRLYVFGRQMDETARLLALLRPGARKAT